VVVVELAPLFGVNVEELDGLVPLAAHLDQLALLRVETHIIRSVWPKSLTFNFKLQGLGIFGFIHFYFNCAGH